MSGAEALRERLRVHARVGLDTSIFIYHLEAHPRYLPLTTAVLAGVQAGEWEGITSVITLMELTVRPWRLGREDVARHYEVLLATFPNLTLVAVDREVAREAARLRAKYNVRPADALQVAAARVHGATAFVTNDRRLSRLADRLVMVQLDEFLSE